VAFPDTVEESRVNMTKDRATNCQELEVDSHIEVPVASRGHTRLYETKGSMMLSVRSWQVRMLAMSSLKQLLLPTNAAVAFRVLLLQIWTLEDRVSEAAKVQAGIKCLMLIRTQASVPQPVFVTTLLTISSFLRTIEAMWRKCVNFLVKCWSQKNLFLFSKTVPS
jgi:hypothetical protein